MTALPPQHRPRSRSFAGAVAALACLALLLWWNARQGDRGSLAFEEQHFASFEPSRGWPLRAWTFGDEHARELADASVVYDGVAYVRDMRPNDARSHLFVVPAFLIGNLLIACCAAWVAWRIGRSLPVLVLASVVLSPSVAAAQDAAPRVALVERDRFRVSGGDATALAFDPGGKLLWAGGKAGDVVAWDLATRHVVHRLDATHAGAVIGIAVSSDGSLVATLGDGLRVFEVPSGRMLHERSAFDDAGYAGAPKLAFLARGEHLAYPSHRSVAAVIDARSGDEIARHDFGKRIVGLTPARRRGGVLVTLEGVAPERWRPDGVTPAIGPPAPRGASRALALPAWGVCVRELATGTLLYGGWQGGLWIADHRVALGNRVTCLGASDDGTVVTVMLDAREVHVFDERGRPRRKLEHPASDWGATWIHVVDASGRRIATAGAGGFVAVFEDGKLAAKLEGLVATAGSLAFTPDGRWLGVAAAGRGHARNLTTKQRIELGAAACVATGWRNAELVLGSERAVARLDLDRRDSTPLFDKPLFDKPLFDAERGVRAIETSAREGELLYEQWSLAGASSVWFRRQDGAVTEIGTIDSLRDAVWSERDGSALVTLESCRPCGNSPRMSKIMLVSEGRTTEFRDTVFDAAVTADFAPHGRQIVHATLSKLELGPLAPAGQAIVSRTATVRWWQFVDSRHALANDGRKLSLWDAKRLLKLEEIQVATTRRAAGIAEPFWLPGEDRWPKTLHAARLSRDRTRVAIAATREIVVYDVRRRGR